MKKAMHPTERRSISVQDYIAEFGPRLDEHGKERLRIRPRCPGCSQPLSIRGEERLQYDPVFAHMPDDNPPYCPLRNQATHRYEFLHDVPLNHERGAMIRASFFQHWQQHWSQLRLLLDKFADIADFIALIQHADSVKFWSRPNLEETDIPYIFLAWKEWPPVEKTRNGRREVLRSTWIRFLFDSRVRTFDDIWIRTQGDPVIIKATYKAPQRTHSPNINHLLDTDVININRSFLDEKFPEAPPFVIKMMHHEFPRELGL